MEDQLQSRIHDYLVIRKLGKGAAGSVYEVRDRHGQHFALKILHAELAMMDVLRDRFCREMNLLKRMSHPNVISVVDDGVLQTRPYFVMPLLDGQPLSSLVKQDGPLSWIEGVEVVQQVLKGLDYIHQRGVVHRDIKAENIIIDNAGHCHVLDFGLALDWSQERLTQHALPMGTPWYMSPEQWSGREVCLQTDLFACGVLLFFLLTGRFPFPGDTAQQVFNRVLTSGAEPLDASGIPKALEEICQRALLRDKDVRFGSAADFLTSLERFSPSKSYPPLAMTSGPPQKELIMTTSPQTPIKSADEVTDPRKLAVLPVEIAPDTYWVGKRPPGEFFYANPYLRCFEGKGQSFNLIIDPGSTADFSVVQNKCNRIIGDISNISAVFVNHQDPDVASSAGLLLGRYAPHAYTLCTEDTWRLIHYYNIPRELFVALEKYPEGFGLPTGDALIPVPSPFCHFVGAMMLYDPQTRVLFTGDLFGGLTDKEAKGLWAEEDDWVGMRAFHQIYMPTNKALRHAIANIRALEGRVDLIAPQHGRLLRGALKDEFIARLERLEVGLDIMSDRQAGPDELNAWSTVLDRGIQTVAGIVPTDLVGCLLDEPTLKGLIQQSGNKVEIVSMGKFVVERAVRHLCDVIDDADISQMLTYEIIFAASQLELPTPSLELEALEDLSANSSMLGRVGLS